MSVLDQMTSGIMQTKATKAAKLTPVAGETGTTVSMMAAQQVLPNDLPGRYMSSEQMGETARSLRDHAATLLGIADSIDTYIESTARRGDLSAPTEKQKAAEAQKAAERAADAKHKDNSLPALVGTEVLDEDNQETFDADEAESFKDRMARLSADAQAAVFTSLDANDEDLPAVAKPSKAAGWTCPEHGDKNLTTTTSRKGRTYVMCMVTDCEAFEK